MSDTANTPEIAHQVRLELIPIGLIEQVFHAALAVAWADGDGEYSAKSQDAKDRMRDLRDAISKADRYTIPVNRQTGEPL